MKESLFEINQMVVYPSHGVGQIMGIETQVIGGMNISVYIVYFSKEKMTIKVPTQKAVQCGLRSLSDESQIQEALKVINGKVKSSRGVMWSRRQKEYEAKINSGDVIAVAEVIRDLIKNAEENPDCSYSEKIVYENALNRLAGEVASSRNCTLQEAIEEIVSIVKVTEIA